MSQGSGAVADTVSEISVLEVREPEVPVMVTVEAPRAAVALALRVTTVAGLALKDAVTPAGNPEAWRVTEPSNGLASVTVIVSVPLAPRTTFKEEAEGDKEKLPVAGALLDPQPDRSARAMLRAETWRRRVFGRMMTIGPISLVNDYFTAIER
jgi:hypothetical protein